MINRQMADTALSKLSRIREELNRMFLERIDLIDGAIVAMLSANHVLIIGPPGTAKSMLADELCRYSPARQSIAGSRGNPWPS